MSWIALHCEWLSKKNATLADLKLRSEEEHQVPQVPLVPQGPAVQHLQADLSVEHVTEEVHQVSQVS